MTTVSSNNVMPWAWLFCVFLFAFMMGGFAEASSAYLEKLPAVSRDRVYFRGVRTSIFSKAAEQTGRATQRALAALGS
jgi:hypothetical protein